MLPPPPLGRGAFSSRSAFSIVPGRTWADAGRTQPPSMRQSRFAVFVSDTLTLEEVFRLLTSVEQELARKVNPTLYSPEEFARRLSDRNPFLQRILSQDVLLLKGVIPDVG